MPLLVGFLFAALRVFLIANIVGMVVRIIVGLGFYFLVMEPVTDAVMGVLTNQFNILPQEVANWIGFLKIDVYFGMILSAYAVLQLSNIVLRKQSTF